MRASPVSLFVDRYKPSGRNECLARNLPNFTGLDKANCDLAVTHLAVSRAPALYLHRQRWALVVRTPILFPALFFFFSRVAEGTHSAYSRTAAGATGTLGVRTRRRLTPAH